MVNATDTSFRSFWQHHRGVVLILLLAAFGARLILVLRFPHEAVDEIRYTAPAANILAGRGFSPDVTSPYLPGEHTVPFYPLFIASLYLVFGQDNQPVRIAQALLDTVTCLLVAFIAFNVAPPKLRKISAFAGLIIYGFLSWFTVSWTRYILTETVAIFFTVAAIAAATWALRGEKWRWLIVGAICGLALLTRADSGLLVVSFILFLSVAVVRQRSFPKAYALIFFCIAIPVVLSPWVLRNYRAFGKFQPLSNPYGKARGEYVPTGYMLWIRTWTRDDTNYHASDLVFHPGSRDFDPRRLPHEFFDSEQERNEVFGIIDSYNASGEMTPEMSDKFLTIANARIQRAPLRFYLWLPLQRAVSMWLTGFSTSSPLRRMARIILVLPILVGGVVGFVFWARNAIVPLLLLIILTRTIFFSFLTAESRYMVEAHPAFIAACAVTVAVIWQNIYRVWAAKTARR
jgi:4-amino-4-deoxy-L-arabinose transferase-like glycosyltransferase